MSCFAQPRSVRTLTNLRSAPSEADWTLAAQTAPLAAIVAMQARQSLVSYSKKSDLYRRRRRYYRRYRRHQH